MDESGKSKDHTRKLIRLKRYETPGEAYFERFLAEFQNRQRKELLEVRTLTLLRDRVGAYLAARMIPQWAVGAGLGAALVMFTLLGGSVFKESEEGSASMEVAQESAPASTGETGVIREF